MINLEIGKNSLVILLAGLVLFSFLAPAVVWAAEPVPPGSLSILERGIVPCGRDPNNPANPSETARPCTACDLFKLILNLIKFVWEFSLVAGTFMLMWGGWFYLTNKPDKGKKIMTNTVIGIVIALVAWLAIDTILKLVIKGGFGGGTVIIKGFGPWNQIECEIVKGAAPLNTPDYGDPNLRKQVMEHPYAGSDDPNENAVRARLFRAGIGVGGSNTRNAEPCPVGVTYEQYRTQKGKGCTSVGGLPSSLINTLIQIKGLCNCDLLITGGTEPGHAAQASPSDYSRHSPGSPVVDINYNHQIALFLKNNAANLGIRKICTPDNLSQYRLGRPGDPSYCNFSEGETHLHVLFSF